MRPDPAASPAPSYLALGVTVVTLALAYGVWYAYSVFLVALLREFGWSRSVLAGAFSVFTLVSGGAGPVLGALADRFGPRRLILIGGVLLAASLWADSFVTRAWHLYLAFGLMTAIGVATPAPCPDAPAPTISGTRKATPNTGPMKPTDCATTSGSRR